MTFDKDTGVYSLKRMLNKIQLRGTKTGDKEMTDVDYEKLWAGVIEQMDHTRNLGSFGGDMNLQKRQYNTYRKEIIDFFVRQLNSRSSVPPLTEDSILRFVSNDAHKYWADIRKM